jgi:hypothetical protein
MLIPGIIAISTALEDLIQKCQRLVTLDIAIGVLTTSLLEQLRKIRNLVLRDCTNFDMESLLNLLDENSNMRNLSLLRIESFNMSTFLMMLSNGTFKNLECLKIWYDHEMETTLSDFDTFDREKINDSTLWPRYLEINAGLASIEFRVGENGQVQRLDQSRGVFRDVFT